MAGPVPTEAMALIQQFEGCHRIDPADGLVHAYPDPLTLEEADTFFIVNPGSAVEAGLRRRRQAEGRPIPAGAPGLWRRRLVD